MKDKFVDISCDIELWVVKNRLKEWSIDVRGTKENLKLIHIAYSTAAATKKNTQRRRKDRA